MSRGPLVVKFGGTSVGSPARIRRAAARVQALQRRGWQPVVVVSAAGHTTDRLLRWLAGVGAASGRAGSREADRALATGEDLSAALLAACLGARGVAAVSLRGGEAGVAAEGWFGAGRIGRVDAAPLRRLLRRGVVPVVAGFQGARADGETLTLGRGGSDTSAVALAAALGPAPCHIVTDVDAVYDRDPNRDAAAHAHPHLSYDALLALAHGGAQVVHPGAAELARAARVPLRVYSFRAPLGRPGGTRIDDGAAAPRLREVAV